MSRKSAMPGDWPVKALVIGAGIGGLTCAVALRRVGIEVAVYERATELRAAGSGLSVMSNAVTALATLGIDLGLDKRGRVVESFTVLDHRGREIRDLPFKEVCEKAGAPSVCLSRSDLQEALLDAAADCPVRLGAVATGFETGDTGVTVRFEDGSSAHGDLLIGADGFHSAVRARLVGPETSQDSGYVCWLGIVPFRHPALAPGGVRHYWGSGQRFGLVDIGHGRAYWWGTTNMPAARSHAWDGTKDEIAQAYAGWADEVRAVIEATPPGDILAVPSRDRTFLERWGEGPVTLLGDAAHPMLTTLGQGSAMAIEDAVVLAHTLAEPGARDDLPLALRTYEDRRRDRTRAMVAASRSMSDLEQADTPERRKVRDDYFRLTARQELARRNEEALTFPGIPDPEPRVRRNLSPLERWYWIADRTSPLNGVIRARLHGPLELPLLRRALDVLQARHPLLRVAISGDDEGAAPAFRPVGGRPIPLRHVQVPAGDPEADARWQREIDEHELAEGIDWRTGPLLRAVVITQQGAGRGADVHDLLLTAAHCMADGMTGLSVLGEWIDIAAQLSAGEEPSRTSRRALPAAEDLLPRPHRGEAGAAALAALMERDAEEARRLQPRRLTPSRPVPFARRRTRMVHRSLTAGQLELLVDACKRHGTTVHGALAAAMVTAVAQEAGTPEPAHFSIGSPLDFRGELDPAVAYDEAGTYAATLPSRVLYRPGTPLWPMARAIARDLADRRQRAEHLSLVNLLDRAGPRTPADGEAFMRYLDEQGPLNLCLSNLGRHGFPDRVGPWRVSGTQLVAGISVTGALVATALTSHGRLAWNFSYIDGMVTAPRARHLADASVHTLLSALHLSDRA
ncbi:FAD-dependent monooxygenase [Streptomyces chattanoogensis]|uniref:Phthiocerol/phthiodiolone dimycocerosyl transferase n=1 Tax=Streptomyces chattanoogensis TaxID=66876 RepID=A0A0N0XWR4_9ACTN|nr:FAD-dependent monooxygenase [Streptomyces chattanoogensis]